MEERLSLFEKFCKFSYKIIKLKAPKSFVKLYEKPLFLTEMKVNADEIVSASVFSLIVGLLIFSPLIAMDFPVSIIFIFYPLFAFFNILYYPIFYSEILRIRAGNETVTIISYMVNYLSTSPVLENAVEFAASHCHGPIGNDMKKLLWKLRSGYFQTIKQGISYYSKKWTLWNEEFVNSLIMLEMVELQPSQEKRQELLSLALERMRKNVITSTETYAAEMKMPSTLLLMFGIILPLMILIVFPLVSIFLVPKLEEGKYTTPFYFGFYLFVGLDLILPIILFRILINILSKRPATYSHSEKIEEVKPEKYVKFFNYKLPILPVAILIGFLISIPGILHYWNIVDYYNTIVNKYPKKEAERLWEEYTSKAYSECPIFPIQEFLGRILSQQPCIIYDIFVAFSVIYGIAIPIIFLTYYRSYKAYQLDNFVRKLEREFGGALFECYNLLYRNVPLEKVIIEVTKEYERVKKTDSPIYIFFREIYSSIVSGMGGIRKVLFGKEGIIYKLPSSLLKNVMEILVSSVERGARVAAQTIKSISLHIQKLHEIEDNLIISLKDISTQLSFQTNFMAPLIAAIVTGASVVLIQLLAGIGDALESVERLYGTATTIGKSWKETILLVDFKKLMPPTFMQLIAGIYLIEIVIIMAIFYTGIVRGFSSVYRDYMIFKFLSFSIILFTILTMMTVIIFQPIIGKIGAV